MTSWLVYPSQRTCKGRRIELAGTDLWIKGLINNVFVYPSGLDVDKFNETLSDTLSSWPFITGRFLVLEGEHYVIEMSDDNGIPVSLVENTDLKNWPLNSNVVVDTNSNELQPFLDDVQSKNLIDGSLDEPLFRLKLTHLKQSGEWVMGASWSHILGDADAFLQFLNAMSCSYQGIELPKSVPVFERRLWLEEEVDETLLSNIKEFLDDEQMGTNAIKNQVTYDHINICFSGEQLIKLRALISDQDVSTQDILCAYIILTLNTHCAQNDDQLIRRANTLINYRNVSDSIAPVGLIANAVLMPLSKEFENPTSILSIAKTIRHSIKEWRNVKSIERWVATADKVMRTIVNEKRLPKMSIMNDRIVLNSNWRYDWANLVDFGHRDKCRFYTIWTRALYLRIFRLNPVYHGTQYIGRDQTGAEIAFRIEKDKKDKFIDAFLAGIAE